MAKILKQQLEELGIDLKEIENIESEETGMKEVELKVPKLSKVQKEVNKYGKIINKYPYINEDGEVLYEIHKMENAPEPYYVARPSEDGAYKYGLGKIKIIPYNLPEILEAKGKKEIIIVTEGESKADCFSNLGYASTTAPFTGAEKWLSRFNKYLKYANVLVIADNDDEGRAFAETTFETISDVAKNIAVLHLEEIYPDLKEGGDIEDLQEIVNNDEKLIGILDEAINELLSEEE